MPVVRISKGSFNTARLADVETLLAESETVLPGPLQDLHGLLHYYVGIDRGHGQLTNVSVWRSLEDAHQMDSCDSGGSRWRWTRPAASNVEIGDLQGPGPSRWGSVCRPSARVATSQCLSPTLVRCKVSRGQESVG